MKRYSREIWRAAGIFLYLYCCSNYMTLCICQGFTGDSDGKNLPAVQETQVQSLGRDVPLEKGMASCLENPMDRGAWQATIHGVAKIRT